MIEGFIAIVFGPFFLGGILIAGVGHMAGARVESLLGKYVRGVATLFMWVLVPVCKGLISLMMQVGENLGYLMNNDHKPVNTTDYSVQVLPPAADAGQPNNSANKSEKKTEPSYDEPIDVDIIEE